MRVYRLLRNTFAAQPFDGEGSFRYGGRWSSTGTRLVYTSEHLSLAMLEYMVHLPSDRLPSDLVVACAEVPASLPRDVLEESELPEGWRAFPAPAALASYGDAFVAEGRAAFLSVPSALAEGERNWLLNPAHPDFGRMEVLETRAFTYDQRLLRLRR